MSNSVEKSRISEKMFKSLFKSITFPSYVWKIVENDLILIEYNTSAKKISNDQIKNDLGRKASDIYKDQSEFYEGLYRCVNSQSNVFKEVKSICMTTGYEKFLSVNYSYVPPDLVLVYTEDITKKKKSEQILKREAEKKQQKLKKSLETTEKILKSLPIGIISIGLDKRIRSVNKVALEILGMDKDDEIIGKFCYSNICVAEKDSCPILDLKQKIDNSERSIVNREGKIIPILKTVLPINLGDENILLEAFMDITDLKQAEKILKESEEKYHVIFENINDMIYVLDEKFEFEYVNASVHERLMGYSKNDLIGKSNLDFLHPEDIKKSFRVLRDAFKGGVGEEGMEEIRVRDNKNIYHWLEIKGRTFRDRDKKLKALLVARDITERKINEQKLRKYETELEKLNLELEQKVEERTKELRESEEKFRTITEQSLLGICIIQDNLIKYINQQFADLLGYTVEEVKNWKSGWFANVIHPEDRNWVMEQARKKQSGAEGVKHYYQYRLITKAGETIWLDNFSKTILYLGRPANLVTVTDITERKLAEQKLKESEENYRNLVENAQEGVWALDENDNTTFVNLRICEMLGYARDEIIGKSLHLFLEDSMMELTNSYQERREKGLKDTYDLELIKKDGTILSTNINAAPILNENGEFKGSFAFINDITNRKIAEQKLKESEEKYRLLAENINDIIVVLDDKFQIEYINEEVNKKILGITKKDVLGKNLLDLVHPDDKTIGLNSLLKGIKDKEGIMEIRVRHRKGHYLWVEAKGKAFLNDKGELKGIVIARDITERKQAEEKLRKSEEQYRTLVETMTDGLVVIDENGCFTYLNMSFSKIIGYSYDELLGTSIFNYFDKKNQSIVEEQLIKRRKGEAQPYELMWTRKDGQKVYTIMAPKPLIDAEGNNIGSFAVITSITERIIAEQKLKASEEKYRSLVETTYDWIWEVDEKVVYTYSSPKIKDILGYDVEEVIGKTPFDFMPSSEAERVRDIFQEALQSNQPIISLESKNLHKNGSIIILETSGVPFFNANGKLLGYRGIDRDITEKMKTKQKLKESEEKYHTLFDGANDAIFLMVKEIFVECNKKTLEMFGCENERDLIGVPPWVFSPTKQPDGRDSIEKALEYINNAFNGKSQRFYWKHSKKDGTTFDAEVSLNRVLIDDKYMIQAIVRDITEHLMTVQKLEESYQKIKESEHQFKLIFDSIPDLFFLIDKDTTILDFKGKEEDLYVPAEKLINSKLRELVPRDIGDLNYIATKKTLLTKQPQILEYELPIQDVNRHFEARHLYFSENQVAVFIREITTRKKTEQNLRESEEKYRQLFENSPEAIMLTNIDGFVLGFNSAAEKIFGFGKNEVMGRSFYQFGIFNSDQIAIIKNRIKDLSLVKQKKFEEFKIKRKNGSLLWVLFQSSIVKLGNEPYILSIAQDITEIKKAEELIEKELIKLKELDEIKNELITRASHEFKTPLTSILCSTELFLNLYKGVYTDDMKQLIEIIYKGGKRLENLVKNTIDISLMESKSISFRREKENIGKLINECVNDLIYLADKRELALELNVQENIFIPIDKNRITQVIKNIVSNAIKNTPPKGNISISLKRMNKHLQILIKDTGVGFTETEKQRLFQKFGKIERYGKDFDVDIEGPGLGLYIAKQIIEMHGGKIWVESEGINKGATFIIELPIDI